MVTGDLPAATNLVFSFLSSPTCDVELGGDGLAGQVVDGLDARGVAGRHDEAVAVGGVIDEVELFWRSALSNIEAMTMSSLPASMEGMIASNWVWSKLSLTPSRAAMAMERS